MALAATLLTSAYNNANAASYTTANITPAANSLLLVFSCVRATTTAGTPTMAGGSLTWTTVNTDLDGIASQGVFTAQCGASPGTFALTVNATGGDGTWIGASWAVIQITGHNTTTPVAQFKFVGGDGTSSAAPTGTLDNAIGNAANRVFCYVTHRANEVTNPRTNWTELNDNAGSAPVHASESQWRNDGTNETTFGATWTTSSRYQMHGVEINIAGVALDGTSTGTSSDTGDLIVTLALAGQTDGVSTVTGDMILSIALNAQSDGTSTTTGDLTVTGGGAAVALEGASDGTSATSGDLVVTLALAATSDGVSTTTGALALSLPLVGTSDGVSTSAGAMVLAIALAASADGASTTTADLTVTGGVPVALDGTSGGTSTATGDLAVAVAFTASSDGSSTITGDLAVAVALVGSSDGTSTTTADMLVGVQVALAGQSDGVSDASATTLSDFVQEGLVSVQVRTFRDIRGREYAKYVVRSR